MTEPVPVLSGEYGIHAGELDRRSSVDNAEYIRVVDVSGMLIDPVPIDVAGRNDEALVGLVSAQNSSASVIQSASEFRPGGLGLKGSRPNRISHSFGSPSPSSNSTGSLVTTMMAVSNEQNGGMVP